VIVESLKYVRELPQDNLRVRVRTRSSRACRRSGYSEAMMRGAARILRGLELAITERDGHDCRRQVLGTIFETCVGVG
jgi:hypothetical protein